jgi:hypothetical protein
MYGELVEQPVPDRAREPILERRGARYVRMKEV